MSDGTSGDGKVDAPIIMKYFKYEHLPEKLQKVSKPFCVLAMMMVLDLPACAERSAGLRHLLEAKDCAVRTLVE